jgi:hypothetical protein
LSDNKSQTRDVETAMRLMGLPGAISRAALLLPEPHGPAMSLMLRDLRGPAMQLMAGPVWLPTPVPRVPPLLPPINIDVHVHLNSEDFKEAETNGADIEKAGDHPPAF